MAINENLRGAAFMALSMAGFAVEDMCLKAAARAMPLGQVMLMVGIAGMIVFAVMATRQSEAMFHPVMISRPMLVRSGFEMVGRVFYALALALTTLSTTSAILQATPLMVIAGAALLFRESVGWRRWSAVLIGFLGVLVILRPGLSGFSTLSLLAVAGMLGFAGRDLATRAAPKMLSNRQLGIMGFAVLAVSGLLILWQEGGPRPTDTAGLVLVAGTAAFGISGYHALTAAMRTGEVGFVTPFRYTRLVFALILAMVVFGERPDMATLAGSALIVGSGVYALLRQRRARSV
ncbi:MAG: DMT family transporter [Gemmobacter sp.]|nr:DMT family transporter [Gemmobacter sp.]